MSKFYFTYGTDSDFPFQGGWTEVEAPDQGSAVRIFKAYHPNREKTNTLNCAFVYTAEQFERPGNIMLVGNFGDRCHEKITLMRELMD